MAESELHPRPDAGPMPAEWQERADANYREMFRAMARVSPDGAIVEDGDLLLVRSGPLLPLNNAALLSRAPTEANDLLARAEAFFAPTRQPWALITSGEATEAMAVPALAAGRGVDSSPGMLLAPLAGSPPPVPGLEIRAVEDVPALHAYNDTMTAGFGGAWARGAILDSRALLEVPGLTHYLGLLDGEPVATAMRFTSHRIAGVYNVSAIPAARGRGIGAAMTWRAALDGRAEGCVASALQASAMGFSIYQRMGYRQFTTYFIWLPA